MSFMGFFFLFFLTWLWEILFKELIKIKSAVKRIHYPFNVLPNWPITIGTNVSLGGLCEHPPWRLAYRSEVSVSLTWHCLWLHFIIFSSSAISWIKKEPVLSYVRIWPISVCLLPSKNPDGKWLWWVIFFPRIMSIIIENRSIICSEPMAIKQSFK